MYISNRLIRIINSNNIIIKQSTSITNKPKYLFFHEDRYIIKRSYSSSANTPLIHDELFKFSTIPKNLIGKLEFSAKKNKDQSNFLENNKTLSNNEIKKISKEIQDTRESVENYNFLKNKLNDYKELNEFFTIEADKESKSLIKSDMAQLMEEIKSIEKSLLYSLLPDSKDDNGNAIIEIRAGTGGMEAQLFALDMLKMYQNYCSVKGWEYEALDISYTDVGGCRDATISISGKGVFGYLKHESGVHRVQRIPDTETLGRVHTSTITVAILPEPQEVDLQIHDRDLRIDVYRSSGNGGQSVNTTDSAVRITHIPTGTVVCMQDERSQHQNRAKAMKVLRARLYESERQRLESERSSARNSQIGTASRSERIRTYNYPQDRITDHRVNISIKNLGGIMSGGDLDEFLKEVMVQFQAKEIESLMASN